MAAIDFRKAFDYIKREKLIEALKTYKVDSKIIDCIQKIYTGDKTIITLNEGSKAEIEITNGIRQGCTGSTTLYKIVTYMILDELENTQQHLGRWWPSGLRSEREIGPMSMHGFEPHQYHFETLCHSPSG